MALNRKLPRVDASRFSMVPRADIPRSTFVTKHTVKTTFQTGYLIPIHVDEVLPGDVHQGKVTIFARLATPLFPIMDNMSLETFFFFCPNRKLWENWTKMMGERNNPADSISYVVPVVPLEGAPAVCSIWDYMGLPVSGGPYAAPFDGEYNALFLRAYNWIWNEWFRDQNLQNAVAFLTDNGPDGSNNYNLLRRNKKHDYFTSALPWPLKGGTEVTTPLSGLAPVIGLGKFGKTYASNPGSVWESTGTQRIYNDASQLATDADVYMLGTHPTNGVPAVFADLSTATGVAINALRLAVQTQRLLERDARSGTRYTELLRAHFGVTPEDTRLQRPEYIGGGRSSVTTQAIPQTSATGLTGGSSPLGALGAAATASDQHQFSYHAKEHGVILGLAHVTGEITYQTGVHRKWTRQTRYDFYWPVFAHLGEQSIRNDEIYATGTAANDASTFGYQERWAEYRHRPSIITGLFRSHSAGTIDPWHLSQKFTSLPALNSTFIQDVPPFARVLAAGSQADNMQILFDSVFQIRTTRAMPMFSVPGLMDHF